MKKKFQILIAFYMAFNACAIQVYAQGIIAEKLHSRFSSRTGVPGYAAEKINRIKPELFTSEKETFSGTWSKQIGGSDYEGLYAIIPLHDGNYLACGNTVSADGDYSNNHGEYDAALVKFDSQGEVLWTKEYGGISSEGFIGIQENEDGTLLAVGYTFSAELGVPGYHGGSDAWMVYLDADGNILSQHCYGGSGYDLAAYTSQSGMDTYVYGYTESDDGDVSGNHGGGDVWVYKINGTSLLWSKCLGGSALEDVWGGLLANGKPTISGFTYSGDGDMVSNHGDEFTSDFYAIQLDESGNILWSKCYGGSSNEQPLGSELSPDHNLLLAGYTSSNDGDVSGLKGVENNWLIKIEATTGNLIWAKTQGRIDVASVAFGIVKTNDNSIIILSVSAPSPYDYQLFQCQVISFSAAGVVQNITTIGGNDGELLYDGLKDEEGNLLLCGKTSSTNRIFSDNHGGDDQWLIRLDAKEERLDPETISNKKTLVCLPNPASTSVTIHSDQDLSLPVHLVIIDIMGNTVFQEDEVFGGGVMPGDIDLSQFRKGFYTIICTSGAEVMTGKLVIE